MRGEDITVQLLVVKFASPPPDGPRPHHTPLTFSRTVSLGLDLHLFRPGSQELGAL